MPMNPRYQRRNRRPPKPPMLLGEPSPSLARINCLNMKGLEQRIEALKVEAVNVSAKLARLKAHKPPPPPDRLEQLEQHLTRLAALEDLAKKRLERKAEAKARYEASRR